MGFYGNFSHICPCGSCDFSRMRAWGRSTLRTNKMADSCSWVSQFYAKICPGVDGTVSWTGQSDGKGEVQLRYLEIRKEYYIYCKTAVRDMMVCELLMLYSFTSCSDKIKTLLTKKSKFHFVQYLKQMVPCESTRDKGVSSSGSRVRTKFYGSIIDFGSERVLMTYTIEQLY